MSIHDSMMRMGAAPSFMSAAGDAAALVYVPPDGTASRTYDARLGPRSRSEEFESTEVALATSKVAIERMQAKVIPKNSATEIVDTGECTIAGESWSIDKIASATGSMIVLELKRTLEREHPAVRRR